MREDLLLGRSVSADLSQNGREIFWVAIRVNIMNIL